MNLRSVWQDLRYAWRTLRRSPGFTVVAVAILGLGIGANTAIFSLVSAVMLRPLPFVEPDRLVVLWEDFSARGFSPHVEASPASYAAWKERARSFEDMAALRPITYNLTGEDEPERLNGTRATANLFSLLGLQPTLGRTFAPDDEGPEAEPVVVVSEDLWVRRFGGDPGLIGRSIRLDGLGHTVIGVVPPDFRFPDSRVDLWVPASFTPQELAQRSAYFYYVVARLEDGTSLDAAQAEMTAIARTFEQENAGTEDVGVTVAALHEQLSRESRPMLLILLAAVGAVLLITCANVANLLLARGTGRRRELALRQALGAAEGRVLQQLLTESVVLAGLGVALGIALSVLSFDYLARLMPGTYPEGAGPALDWRVLSFTAGLGLVTALLFGTGPALAAGRLPPNDALKSGGVSSVRSGPMRNALVVGEITLTVVLLAAAGLLLRSYAEVLDVDPGFRPENLLIAETALSPAQYDGLSARTAFYERVLERVKALPGVSSAGYVSYPPLVFKGGRSLITVDGRPPPPPEDLARNIVSHRTVSEGYMPTLGVPLLQGRRLDARDTPGAPGSVLINEAMARLHWPGENPLGARLRIGDARADADEPWFTVVGVVGNVRQMGLDVPPEPEMYFSFAQNPGEAPFYWPSHLVVRTAGDPLTVAEPVRNAVWEVDASQPVSNVRAMADVLDAELANRDAQLALIGGFAIVALFLAAVGLYGLLSYRVAQRTSEIGLRMALGAPSEHVVRGVVRSGALLAGAGIALGMAGTVLFTRPLADFLFGVTPTDPLTLAAVSATLLVAALLASYVPARRASDVDPLTALRAD